MVMEMVLATVFPLVLILAIFRIFRRVWLAIMEARAVFLLEEEQAKWLRRGEGAAYLKAYLTRPQDLEDLEMEPDLFHFAVRLHATPGQAIKAMEEPLVFRKVRARNEHEARRRVMEDCLAKKLMVKQIINQALEV